MCGRYVLSDTEAVKEKFKTKVSASFNIAPSQDEKTTNICVPQNLSIKKIRLTVLSFIIDNAELMSVEANKVLGKFYINNFKCKN